MYASFSNFRSKLKVPKFELKYIKETDMKWSLNFTISEDVVNDTITVSPVCLVLELLYFAFIFVLHSSKVGFVVMKIRVSKKYRKVLLFLFTTFLFIDITEKHKIHG